MAPGGGSGWAGGRDPSSPTPGGALYVALVLLRIPFELAAAYLSKQAFVPVPRFGHALESLAAATGLDQLKPAPGIQGAEGFGILTRALHPLLPGMVRHLLDCGASQRDAMWAAWEEQTEELRGMLKEAQLLRSLETMLRRHPWVFPWYQRLGRALRKVRLWLSRPAAQKALGRVRVAAEAVQGLLCLVAAALDRSVARLAKRAAAEPLPSQSWGGYVEPAGFRGSSSAASAEASDAATCSAPAFVSRPAQPEARADAAAAQREEAGGSFAEVVKSGDPARIRQFFDDVAARGDAEQLAGLRDPKGNGPLHWAAIAGQGEMARWMLELRVSPDVQNSLGETPLSLAVRQRAPLTFVRMLLSAAADVNVADRFGETPLMEAGHCGDGKLVQELLQALADPQKRSAAGQRACDVAPVGSQARDLLNRCEGSQRTAAQEELGSGAAAAAAAAFAPKGECALCGQPAKNACSLCHKVYYCGKTHQKQDWKQHKKVCRGKDEDKG